MMSFGKFGSAPEAGEEIAVQLTRWDRIADWVLNRLFPDPTVKYEREVLLQIARRYKLKNDRLQRDAQSRRKPEKPKKPPFKLVATLRFPFWHKDAIKAFSIWSLVSNGESNRVEFVSITNRDTLKILLTQLTYDHRVYVQQQPLWTGSIQPWAEGTISTRQLQDGLHDELQFAVG
jgi:hypothetical protein